MANFESVAATAMTAAVNVRSAGHVGSAFSHSLHARAVSGIYFQKRQAAVGEADVDKKFQEFEATLTDEQKAKEKEIDQKAQAADDALDAGQKSKLDEVDQLDAAGKTAEADAKFKEFEGTLTDEQKAKAKAVDDAATQADALLTDAQKKALDEIDRLDAQLSGKGNGANGGN